MSTIKTFKVIGDGDFSFLNACRANRNAMVITMTSCGWTAAMIVNHNLEVRMSFYHICEAASFLMERELQFEELTQLRNAE